MASSRCRICRRALKNPKWVALGMGPTCAKRAGLQTSIMPEDPDYVLIPFTGDVVCRREGNTKYMNIPQTIVQHSPDGMEWGYTGSGPADFALNVLFFFTEDKEFAQRWHQDFKFAFIAGLPREGGSIPGDKIWEWINYRKSGTPTSLRDCETPNNDAMGAGPIYKPKSAKVDEDLEEIRQLAEDNREPFVMREAGGRVRREIE